MLVSNHIGKTAGGTLQFILQRNYGDNFLGIYSALIKKMFGKERTTPSINPLDESELNFVLNQYGKIECLSSHFIKFPNSFNNFKIITFLRNSVDRVVSKYFSLRKKYLGQKNLPNHMIYDYRYDMRLFFDHWEYVSTQYNVQSRIDNFQTYVINNANNLDGAVNSLKNEYWFVGITERFDECLLLLKNQFQKIGIDFNIMYTSQHVGSYSYNNHNNNFINDNILQKIQDINEKDNVLYHEAKLIMKERLNNYDGDLESDLYKYRKELKKWNVFQRYVPRGIKAALRWFRNKYPVI